MRVVSMPSTSVFDRQDAAYQAAVLPEGLPRIAVEAGHTNGWYKYVGLNGAVVGINRFGESAPADLLFKAFGFTVDNVVDTVKNPCCKPQPPHQMPSECFSDGIFLPSRLDASSFRQSPL